MGDLEQSGEQLAGSREEEIPVDQSRRPTGGDRTIDLVARLGPDSFGCSRAFSFAALAVPNQSGSVRCQSELRRPDENDVAVRESHSKGYYAYLSGARILQRRKRPWPGEPIQCDQGSSQLVKANVSDCPLYPPRLIRYTIGK